MAGTDRALTAGRQAVRSLRSSLLENLASLLQKDPERLANAVELGLVSRDWLEDPSGQPISTATPMEVVQRYLDRSVEQRPSMLASLGLTAIQVLSAPSEDSDDEPGARHDVVVAFTDLEGFTRFTSQRGDEAATELLTEHRRVVGPVIRGRGGRIVKRIGDGLMLTFLEPEAAVLACLEMVDAHPGPLRLRAGIHQGEVILTRGDLVGHTVNVAARVTEAARGDEVLVTVAVRDAIGEMPGVRFGRARRRSFKGLAEPVLVSPVYRTA